MYIPTAHRAVSQAHCHFRSDLSWYSGQIDTRLRYSRKPNSRPMLVTSRVGRHVWAARSGAHVSAWACAHIEPHVYEPVCLYVPSRQRHENIFLCVPRYIFVSCHLPVFCVASIFQYTIVTVPIYLSVWHLPVLSIFACVRL